MSLAALAPAARLSFDGARAERQRDRAERRAKRVLQREAVARCQCVGCRIDRSR